MKKLLLVFVASLLIATSCKKEKEPTSAPIILNDESGLFILNQGGFTASNASLTFYDPVADTVANNLFYKVNNSPIGDVAQDLTIWNNSLYLVVNNSNYIYKTNAETIEYQSKIENFYSPRHLLVVSDEKAYVSDMMAAGLWIINPTTMQHLDFVETDKSTENMVKVGKEIFVTNWSNWYLPETVNNSVQIIDTESDSYVGEITVSLEPNSIAVDKNKHIWVLCDGGYSGEEKPMLHCIDPSTRQIIKQITFGGDSDYPSCLTIDATGENLYYLNTDVYRLSIESETAPEEPIIKSESNYFFGLAINPNNGDIYVTDAGNFVINGKVYRYDKNGNLLKTINAGIGPFAMLFN